MKTGKIVKAAACVLCVWLALGIIDLFIVMGGSKPFFAFPIITADDGGSGRYIGPGWSFDIEGNFMPEDNDPGVKSYDYYLFGIKLF